MVIASMRPEDWPAVLSIYVEGLATRNATFETEPPSWERWNDGHLDAPRLVMKQDGQVAGWAALSRVSTRAVYSGVAEVSIYLAASQRGKGLAGSLFSALIHASEQAGIWTLQSSIFAENKASIALHERFGFRQIGRRERIGQMDGIWRDTILMERRSLVVGV